MAKANLLGRLNQPKNIFKHSSTWCFKTKKISKPPTGRQKRGRNKPCTMKAPSWRTLHQPSSTSLPFFKLASFRCSLGETDREAVLSGDHLLSQVRFEKKHTWVKTYGFQMVFERVFVVFYWFCWFLVVYLWFSTQLVPVGGR